MFSYDLFFKYKILVVAYTDNIVSLYIFLDGK